MSTPQTITDYMDAVAPSRQAPMKKLLAIIRDNLPPGFEERMNYGMPSWVVPHSMYANGYHVNPDLPLPFLALASQKSHIGLYHMGIYADTTLMEWFVHEYPAYSKTKLHMGKSCIRFKSMANIPYDLVGALCARVTPQQWIELYEGQIKPR